MVKSDIINQRFGNLIVIKERLDITVKNLIVECICTCGVVKTFRVDILKNNSVKSCGCLRKELAKEKFTKHGLRYSLEYKIWTGIKDRCYNEKSCNYKRYGGRGITMSDEWFNSFETFYQDIGTKPTSLHSLDRKDNNKGYSKENCRWATKEEQANNRRNNNYIKYNDKTQSLADWCRELDINYPIIRRRLCAGMLFEVAISIDRIHAGGLLTLNKITKTLLEWCSGSRSFYLTVINRLRESWTFTEALEPIEKRIITFNIDNYGKSPETLSLEDWCDLLRLDKTPTYLRILRGESFEDIVKE